MRARTALPDRHGEGIRQVDRGGCQIPLKTAEEMKSYGGRPRFRKRSGSREPSCRSIRAAHWARIATTFRRGLMLSTKTHSVVFLAAFTAFATATAFAQGGLTKPKQGQGGSVVKGSAGTDGSSGDSGLEHCDKPMGALAVVEAQHEISLVLAL